MKCISARMIISQSVLVVFSLGVGLLLAEGILALTGWQPLYAFERGLFQSSSRFGYHFQPNVIKRHSQPEYDYAIHTNSWGFRGPEPYLKASRRVLVLGDSLGMGQGIQEGRTLTDLARRYFDHNQQQTDILNTSVSGYTTVNHQKVLKVMLTDYRPDLSVLLFFWNDIGQQNSLNVQNGYLVLSDNTRWRRLREWANNHSRVYCLIKRVRYLWEQRQRQGQHQSRFGQFRQSDMRRTANMLRRMNEQCQQRLSDFVVVLLPAGGIYQGDEAFLRHKTFFIDELRSHGVAYEDWGNIVPPDQAEEMVFPLDRHWNEQGHKWMSRHLINLIQQYIKPIK